MAIIKRGENKYLIRVYVTRHPITKKRIEINETFYGTEEEAVKHEQLLKTKAARGELSKPSRITLNQLIDLYLDNTRHFRSEASQRLTRDQFARYVQPYLGDQRVEKITRKDIQQLLNFLLAPKKVSKDNAQEK